MGDDEKKIEAYLAKSNTSVSVTEKPVEKNAEDQVEDKAREKGPLSASVLQKRSKLEPAKLENRIGQVSAKYADRIDEAVLRQRIAAFLDEHNQEISEADLQRIVDGLLKEPEKEEPAQPGIAPPPFVQDSLTAVGDRARATADWMAGLKTPGGVGFLVFVLVFFVWVIVPVGGSGQTRLQLLWGVLTGQVGFSQSVQSQRDQIAEGAVNQLFPGSFPGTPAPSTNGTGGGQIIPVEQPFIPSFEEF